MHANCTGIFMKGPGNSLLHNNMCYTTTSVTQQHLPRNNICHTTTSATQHHLPHNNICHTTTSATQQHLPHNNICYTTTSATQQHLPHNNICHKTTSKGLCLPPPVWVVPAGAAKRCVALQGVGKYRVGKITLWENTVSGLAVLEPRGIW